METPCTIGIIDIGSNTVRLSVYHLSETGAYRTLDQARWPARLAQRIDEEGRLPHEAIEELGEVFTHYLRICRKHHAHLIRAVATAALRQAVNRDELILHLHRITGLTIELLSGEEEARIGSRAMLNSLTTSDCFVVDLGGGSTEVTLIKERKIVSAVSFPIGCLNTSARLALGEGPLSSASLKAIQTEVHFLLSKEDGLSRNPGLPLIGLGGTLRTVAKLHQREFEYPLPILHGYEINNQELSAILDSLAPLSVDQRSKRPRLSKDRGEMIVPGLAILLGVIRHMQTSEVLICGMSLRDGLFFDTCLPHLQPSTQQQLLEESIRNLNARYPITPVRHLHQVHQLAMLLYENLISLQPEAANNRHLLNAASRLFRIGAGSHPYDPTAYFNILLQAHWNGLSHREIVLTAGISSYSCFNALTRHLQPYHSLLQEGDIETTAKLGSLLLLAAALDRNNDQAIIDLKLTITAHELRLTAYAERPVTIEQLEVGTIAKEFDKNWGITPILTQYPD